MEGLENTPAVITPEILKEFKERMKIFHSTEDENLKRILSACLRALNQTCGSFDLSNETGKELVFERARYVYNDSLELFSDSFLTEILNFSLSLMKKEGAADEENI